MKDKLTHDEIRELSTRGAAIWLRDAVVDWLIIGFSCYLFNFWMHPVSFLVLLLVIGNRQHALAVLGHEASHFRLSENKRVNDLLANLGAFWSLGITTSGYRSLHNKHHSHTNTEQDPELAHRGARAPQWDLPISIFKILRFCAEDLIGFSHKDYLIIITFSKPNSSKEYLYLFVFHVTLTMTLVIIGLWWVPAIWYIALFTSFMMFFRLRTFLEHLGTEDTHRLYLTWLERQVMAPHNIWYHWEHHKYPTVPYYRLPEIRHLLQDAPVQTLSNLISFYGNCQRYKSGEVLK